MKKYTIQEKDFTLADVSPKRFAKYCSLLGISNFEEMQNPEMQKKLNVSALNIFKDPVKVKEIISVCVNEDVNEIMFDDIPSKIFNEVLNDFFSQLLTN